VVSLSGYTVIDLETTGLFPQMHDRVVEIGVAYLDDDGTIRGEWSSLVNPERDIGPTHIHGISARDVLKAPTFTRLAPYVVQAVAGRTVVAHNARFDLLFLEFELRRAGLALEPATISGLCTMEWSTRFLRASSRRLSDCCSAAGVTLANAHCAADDAHGTAELLAHYIRSCAGQVPWSAALSASRAYVWPQWPPPWPEVSLCRRATPSPRRPDAWMDRVVAGMPRHDDPAAEAYLDLLEAALLDRYLSEHEEQALADMATRLGVERSTLTTLHREYLHGMAAVALADGILTSEERAELDQVAHLLGLSPADVDEALVAPGDAKTRGEFRLHVGDHICLTGQMSRPREDLTEDAERIGLIAGSLTKHTRLLVAADPDSQSGRAEKARSYGIPVVNEETYQRLYHQLADV
jgi:DNA polymerase-3 subunit epsilon